MHFFQIHVSGVAINSRFWTLMVRNVPEQDVGATSRSSYLASREIELLNSNTQTFHTAVKK
ncbi:unnamed protein product [Acanthoscelides obtectus]|uniref:Uncharacterized protein n=1 Tax=Acanthoscelides obtectus TaxID=200917 RepID=A0A9P0JQP2_ACAOB|nr:unnamed protein product [Acanthoscelides obtectus]CAK1661838.1 hypothetical protein AOBTE_LOCUS22830 [Acanthoscelides obtectus]